MKSDVKRNYYLDNIRGIAAIVIILIHTSWHSGYQYVPELIRNLTLLFEVPMFFFLAGWTLKYSKSTTKYIKKILTIQLQYMFYITLVFVLIFIWSILRGVSFDLSGVDLIKWYFHNYTSMYPFISVEASLWFFPVYFIVTITMATYLTLSSKKYLKLFVSLLIIALALISFKFNQIGNINIFISLNFLIFYSIFYLLGYLLSSIKLNLRQLIYGLSIVFAVLLIISNITDLNIFNLQFFKFPPHFIYLLWSLIGVLVVLYFKNYEYCFKKNILSFFGQNAIYSFFAQGISSSILYKIVPYINIDWYFKLPICFIINFIMAFILIFVIKYSYNTFIKLITIFKNRVDVIYEKLCHYKTKKNEDPL